MLEKFDWIDEGSFQQTFYILTSDGTWVYCRDPLKTAIVAMDVRKGQFACESCSREKHTSGYKRNCFRFLHRGGLVPPSSFERSKSCY